MKIIDPGIMDGVKIIYIFMDFRKFVPRIYNPQLPLQVRFARPFIILIIIILQFSGLRGQMD